MSSVPRTRDRSRRFDIVLFGATGFTGQLVGEYLATHYGASDLRIALGGRNRARLEEVRASLAGIDKAAADWEIVVADSHDVDALDAMAGDAEVVLSTVGPYAKYGSELVAACVVRGTDYCDLTGEVQWIRRMIDAHQSHAAETGARIVHCCGFDSIPSDIGTLVLQEAAIAREGRPCDRVDLHVVKMKGGASGGTVASMLNIATELRDPEVRRILADPYSLCPGEPKGGDGPDQVGARYDRELGVWTGPFVMAAVNSRVVRRSNTLLGYRYGRDFRYQEVTRTSRGPAGFAKAAALSGGVGGMLAAMAVPPLRGLLKRTVLPAPGEGPTREQIESGFFVAELIGRFDDGTAPVKVKAKGQRDPGYGATSGMIAESALCLALDGGRLEVGGGVWTPASAMGAVLRDRLVAADVTFEVV